MPDQFDAASEAEQRFRDEALKNAKKPEGPTADGICKWCGNKIAAAKRFCSVSCRDDWQHYEDRK